MDIWWWGRGGLAEHFPLLLTILFALDESSLSACPFTGTGTISHLFSFLCFYLKMPCLRTWGVPNLQPSQPFFFPNPITASILVYIVDHAQNRSPWQLACLGGHVEHPKNTVQDSEVSLVTTGRKYWPTSSFCSFLPSVLLSFLSCLSHSPSHTLLLLFRQQTGILRGCHCKERGKYPQLVLQTKPHFQTDRRGWRRYSFSHNLCIGWQLTSELRETTVAMHSSALLYQHLITPLHKWMRGNDAKCSWE